jgi:1,4-dihydroxy-2-naphthoate octaprenyltransferase
LCSGGPVGFGGGWILVDLAMWWRALRVIPRIEKEEWDRLDVVSRWLVATRAAVLVMTFLSAAIAGILALRDGAFDLLKWALVVVGLCLAHATNNLLNDYVDFVKGVDQDNYYRAQYGPQPLVHGLMSKGELLQYAALTGLAALACGVALTVLRGGLTPLLMALGAFFVLFYTWPLKYIAMGEIAVLIVWGPLMIGGGYYAISGVWDWRTVIASLPYALGVTGVIFGKHIDKYQVDRSKGIHTLPVLLGEAASRYVVVAMFAAQYLLVAYLVLSRTFTPLLLVVLLALPTLFRILPMFRRPRPAEKPAGYPDVWPNYFVAAAFVHNRAFGMWFLLGLMVDAAFRVWGVG